MFLCIYWNQVGGREQETEHLPKKEVNCDCFASSILPICVFIRCYDSLHLVLKISGLSQQG